MNYLIIQHGHAPFYTNWFHYPNHFIEGMTVINLLSDTYTTDGRNWNDIAQDHL